MEYQIIKHNNATCVLLNEEVLIDCGCIYRKLEEYIKNLKVILITHAHTDHLHINSLYNIIKNNKDVIVLCNRHTLSVILENKLDIPNLYCIEEKGIFKCEDYIFTPYLSTHDVECYAWHVNYLTNDIFYSTDTSDVLYYPYDIKFDMIFIEWNYSKKIMHSLLYSKSMSRKTLKVIANLKRHLSYEDALDYYIITRKGKGKLIPLNENSKFMGNKKVIT